MQPRMQDDRIATVFGGTGFLGRRVVDRLVKDGWHVRIACRHPDKAEAGKFKSPIEADIQKETDVAGALDGASAAVNAVSLYVEGGRGGATFDSVHVDGANRLAHLAADLGIRRFVHISGIGVDKDSRSAFIRARANGERRIRAALPEATIFRPSVMFGRDDAFFNRLADLLSKSPVFPLIGGETRVQPAWVDDVAHAASIALGRNDHHGRIYELGGPDILTMRELAEWLRETTGLRRLIVPVPLMVARVQARLFERLPSPPITSAQVELLAKDNVAAADIPGFEDIGISPRAIGDVVPSYIGR